MELREGQVSGWQQIKADDFYDFVSELDEYKNLHKIVDVWENMVDNLESIVVEACS